MKTTKLRLLFPSDLTAKPLTYHLVKDFDLVYNIFQAHIKPGMKGDLIIEVIGRESNIEKGINFLVDSGVTVDILTKSINLDEDGCVHCGACTAVCPSEALYLDGDAKLCFDNSKCIVCELCVEACPARVIKVNFSDN